MNYQSAVDYFFSKLSMYSKDGKKALRPRLDNIRSLISILKIDMNKVPYVHVAGTNGKGSTCHILAAACQQAGLKTGLLTSPHLVDLRERVKIDGELVSEDILLEFVKKVQAVDLQIDPSYFEMNVALAFYTFAKLEVDIAIIETGLGGRWDSTNIITPVLSVITSIDYDHMDVLGHTLDKIAYEKAGIIKPAIPVLIGKKQTETESVFIQVAMGQNAPIFFAEDFFIPITIGALPENNHEFQYKTFFEIQNQSRHSLKTDLMGDYQWENIRTAWAAIRILQHLGWQVTDSHVIDSIQQVKSLTNLRGRWDIYSSRIILDVGHNPEGVQTAIKNLSFLNKKYKILYGCVKDKDVNKCVTLLPQNTTFHITQAQVPRAMPVDDLEKIFIDNGITKYTKFHKVSDALASIIPDLNEDEMLLILGSFFIVGEAYEYLDVHSN